MGPPYLRFGLLRFSFASQHFEYMKDRCAALEVVNSHHSYLAANVALEALWCYFASSSSSSVPDLPVSDERSNSSVAVGDFGRVLDVVLGLWAVASHRPCCYQDHHQGVAERVVVVVFLIWPSLLPFFCCSSLDVVRSYGHQLGELGGCAPSLAASQLLDAVAPGAFLLLVLRHAYVDSQASHPFCAVQPVHPLNRLVKRPFLTRRRTYLFLLSSCCCNCRRFSIN